MSKTVLLIIDVQNAMFNGEEGSVYNGEKVLNNILKVLNKAREKDVPVIFVQHTDKEGEYKEGEETWQLNEKLSPKEGEVVVQKGTWDAFYKTKLEEELKKLKAEKLVICGMQTEFCLDTTIRNAYSRGYEHNVVIEDAHTTFDSRVLKADKIIEHHSNIWEGRFANLIKADEINL
ncbi:isochorismatase family protein [Clostridium felsineum]|uniref:isochorismatase family protein n=1 Tax=Clostridium felsineum TaxID=36839 RepID=UPI00098C313B|nr:isochorismatase family protein [Clostridium felsineum]URZ03992.1 Streptothricin hydrolase [Clostridium felsineum]